MPAKAILPPEGKTLRYLVEMRDCWRVLVMRESFVGTIPGYKLESQQWSESWGWTTVWTLEV